MESVASSIDSIILSDTEPAIVPHIVPAVIPPVIPAHILALSAEVLVIPPIASEAKAALRSKVAVHLSSPGLSSSSPSTLVLLSTPVEAIIAPSIAVAPHFVHTSPIRLSHVMTPARSVALRLSRARPSTHLSGSSPSSSSSSSYFLPHLLLGHHLSIEESFEASIEPDIDLDILANIEANIAADAATAFEAKVEVKAKVEAEVEADVEVDEMTRQRMISSLVLVIILRLRTITITRSGMTPEAIKELINQRVAEALAEQESNHNLRPIIEGESENRDDNRNGNGGGNQNGNDGENRNGNGRGNGNVNGEGNGNNGNNNENGNRNGINRGSGGGAPVAQIYTYKDFLNCQPQEEDKIERFIWGLPDNIQRNMTSSKPTRLHDDIKMANSLMDKKVRAYAVKNAKIKRKWENQPWDNRVQQPPFKRQNVARAYTVGNNKNYEKRGYAGSLLYYNKCKLHHEGQCTVRCIECKKVGHINRDCKAADAATTQRALVMNQKTDTLFRCEGQGHYKSDCPKLKNQNLRKQDANSEACRRAYALGGGEANPDSNIVTGTFLINNRYEYILFDLGVDRSFVSTTFSSLIDIIPTTLDASINFVAWPKELGVDARGFGFEDPDSLNRVYKVEKALYGLHQAPRAWYETLSTYLLDNGFQRGEIDKTLFIKRHKGDILLVQVYVDDIIFGSTKKDEDGEEVDVHMYRSMIGSLMYLTSSRPDIMFAVCACARYQVNPKVSHLHAVKRIFRASLDRKSTIGGCQFLGCRLISWQCKKQTVVANSTTEAEYVAASSCLDKCFRFRINYLIMGITYYFWENVNDVEESDGFEQIMDHLNAHPIRYALTVNPTKYISFIEQFWSTAMAKTINGEAQLHARVDGKKIIITEVSIKRDLQLDNEDGVDCLPNSTIFKQLALMRVGKGFSEIVTPLFPIMVVQYEFGEGSAMPTDLYHTPTILQSSSSQPQKTHKPKKPIIKVTQVRAATTASSLEVEQDSGNITKTQSEATPNEPSSQGTDSGGAPSVLELDKTKTSQHNDIGSLKRRVKKLEKRIGKDMFDVDDLCGEEVFVAEQKVVSTAATTTTITTEELTLAQVLEEIKTSKPKAKRVVIQEPSESTTTIPKQQSQNKRKRIMIEEPVKPKKKDQIRIDEKAANRLQAEFDEEERLAREISKKEQEANIELIKTWDDIQEKIDADHQLGYKLKDLKLKEFDSIQEMFDKAFKRVNTFKDFRTELVERKEKRAGEELKQEIIKKQKVDDDKEKPEIKQLMETVPNEEVAIDAILLAVKSPRTGV
uniref:CCHC-type domain-containing protein n=1 Tax=Tanacetum cinerariifolium TaxID=118510 RepID=A0A6L2L683_TANCI|nr:hypothetical protein [Tanacetum cinerariifolium]